MTKTSIIILTYNNLDYNKNCIYSIKNFTPKGSYEIIVVDNNSSDGTAEWLKEQKDIKTILNNENKGFPAGCNQGIAAAADGNDILLLNNDTIVTPNWLDNLQACLHSNKEIGAVGAVSNSCSNYQAINTSYKDIKEMLEFSINFNVHNPELWEERVRLIGFCLLIKNEVVKKVGLLDEIFTPGNYEDDDYTLRIRKAGYRLILCKDCFIHHFGSTSFNANNQKFNNLLKTNREKFAQKWNVDPLLFSVDERLILEPLLSYINNSEKILVVNSASGAVPLYLKSRLKSAEISCVQDTSLDIEILHKDFIIKKDIAEFGNTHFDSIIILTFARSVEFSSIVQRAFRLLDFNSNLIIIGENETLHKLDKSKLSGSEISLKNNSLIIKKSKREFSTDEIKNENYSEITSELSENVSVHNRLKLLLRQIDENIAAEKNTQLIYNLLSSGAVTNVEFTDAVIKGTANKASIFNDIGSLFYNENRKVEAISYILIAYKYNSQDKNIVFNLAYVLAEKGEVKNALDILSKFENPDEEMLELKNVLSKALN